MAERVLRLLENFSEWSIALTGLIVILSLQTSFWQREAGTRQARGTMFGARVGPEFLVSAEAASIRRTFRFRIWLLTLIAILAFVLFAGRVTLDPAHSVSILIVASLVGNTIVFGLAHRQTRRQAGVVTEPSTRTALLTVAEDESSAWLSAVEWAGILLPLGIPLASIAIIVLRWNDYPVAYSPLNALKQVSLYALFGVVPAATCYSLRFGARSSDWASDPLTSRRYRTVLGLTVSSTFTFIILQGCWLPLMPLLQGASFENLNAYFYYSMIGYLCLALGGTAMMRYLARHRSRDSTDPMPDRCWKWGYFYYNPADPALIVPLRSGRGCSFNHARRSFWVVTAAVIAAILFTFISFFGTPSHILTSHDPGQHERMG
jgi:uncharacterized membrane protein